MKENKEYYAFISYKSEDVEWAIWLQHELEHYHLPASFNGRTDIRQELRPVFRDIDELSAGNLPEQIRQALENSQNLIVVCSPQAAASPWVNQEVETFISLGRTDRIFPFIVEGNSPKEFFPPALLALPKNEERLGGYAAKQGRDIAFVKVVAGLLGLGFDSLWNRYEKEKAEKERKEREDKEKLQIAQSRFVAEKALSLINSGDSFTARKLLLEVLPFNICQPDKPITIEAEIALRKSIKNNTAIISGHSDRINYVAFSFDSKRIVSASDDMTIRQWDAFTGKQITTPLTGHTQAVLSANFSLDGKYIVSVSWDGTIRLWDAVLGKQVRALLPGGCCGVNYAEFSPNTKLIVSSSSDKTIRLWDVKTGKQIMDALKGHTGSVTQASFSPDGKQIVSASEDGTIRLWDVVTGKQLGTLIGHTGSVRTARFSPDGKRVISSSEDKTIRLWDVSKGKQIGVLKSLHLIAFSASFSPDGKLILVAGYGGIIVFDSAKREQYRNKYIGGGWHSLVMTEFTLYLLMVIILD